MKEHQKLGRILFGVYCAVMLYLLFFQRTPHFTANNGYLGTMRDNLNIIPFDTIARYLRLWSGSGLSHKARANLLGNVVLFVPLGFFLPWVHEKLRKFWRTLLVSVGLILLVEGIQLVTLLGHCDVDDLILNVFGVVIGYVIWRLIEMKDPD